MKQLLNLRFAAASLVLSFVAFGFGCASPAETMGRAGEPVRLQLQVRVPANMNPFRSQDVEDAFGDRIATALHEQGFHGRIAVLWDTDEPNPSLPLLSIFLTEWRVDVTGNVNCTFTADLRTPVGERGLGVFTGTSMMTWADRDWFMRANDFTDAAASAASDLWHRIQDTGLLPPENAPAMAPPR